MKNEDGADGGNGTAAAGVQPSFETLLSDVPLELSVELGRITLSLRDVAARLGPGSIIALTKLTGEKLDVRINERLVARAEAVAIGERYGIRIVELIRSAEGGKLP
jgi:flagellar motor switch protein FliN/FliY